MSEPQSLPLSALEADRNNANRGTERGRQALLESLKRRGAGRSILLDKHDRIIAGNKTVQQAIEAGISTVRIVESDGRELIAHRRSDLDLDEPEGRLAAFEDNQIAAIDLEWIPEQIDAALKAEIDLSHLWTGDELEELLKDAPAFPEFDEESFADVAGDMTAVTFQVPLGEVAAIEAQVERIMELRDLQRRDKGQVLMLLTRLAAAATDEQLSD